ncbi:hypothetical protein BKA67DRAFT_529462 [Truncatella angustata]|uniref:Uncharacterized protein n=1 Tax=Truncatella angustata TaxID=152316 RepID=A0A9P9A3W4_9PEZI|nr:uncharacterized protein BKA67DRAFT_529462 [Truncatella angustata]KAH6659299.1 hypothetical protein BKA67DRAFT_529462 [Truncatella angustata]
MPVTIKPSSDNAEIIAPCPWLDDLQEVLRLLAQESGKLIQSSFDNGVISPGMFFSVYVNAHTQELRDHFVEYIGKQDLTTTYGGVTGYTVNITNFTTRINKVISENVVHTELCGWIRPNVSPTTKYHVVVASIAIKKAFSPTSLMALPQCVDFHLPRYLTPMRIMN